MGKTTTINSSTNPLVLAISIFGILTTITLLSAIFIMNQRSVSAESTSASASVNVSSACTFSSNTDSTHSTEIAPETWQENIGKTSFAVKCNDSGGYAVYAVGYSNDEWNNNTLVGPNSNVINTGTATTGNNSTWSMKLLPGEGDTASIVSPYNDYAVVPGDQNDDGDDSNNSYTKVATYNSTTLGNTGSSFAVTYKSYIAKNQAAGDYAGKVKFAMVHPATAPAPEASDPKIYMQDLDSASIAALLPNEHSTATVYDKRDEQAYTIAKLKDSKYWMTTNLNLAGGTTLNASDSNVPSDNYYTLPASTAITSGTSVPSDQFSNNFTAYVFNTGNNTTTCNSSTPCNSYYSWPAATVGGKDSSGAAVIADGYNAAYSICPKGWRLPTSTTSNASAQTSPNWKTGDWYALMTAYGANLESNYYQSGSSAFYNNAGPGTTPNFLLAGDYGPGSFYLGGSAGLYWSATSSSSPGGYLGSFGSSSVNSANIKDRRIGYSVRCLFAE